MSTLSIASTVVDTNRKRTTQSRIHPRKELPSNTKTEMVSLPLGLKIDQVRRLHAAVTVHAHDVRVKALKIGELLAGIKNSLSHGKWLPWLTVNLPEITPRTAQNYMRVWTHRELIKNESNSFLVENLTAALGKISARDKDDPEANNDATNANAVNRSHEQTRKRELLRDLGRDFIAGLETEEIAILELVASRLPAWRCGLLEAARRGIAAEPADPRDMEVAWMAA